MGYHRPLFRLFSSFQTNITTLTKKLCLKMSIYMQNWDSNPQPSGHESPPITTTPGLPPTTNQFCSIGPCCLSTLQIAILWHAQVSKFAFAYKTKISKIISFRGSRYNTLKYWLNNEVLCSRETYLKVEFLHLNMTMYLQSYGKIRWRKCSRFWSNICFKKGENW